MSKYVMYVLSLVAALAAAGCVTDSRLDLSRNPHGPAAPYAREFAQIGFEVGPAHTIVVVNAMMRPIEVQCDKWRPQVLQTGEPMRITYRAQTYRREILCSAYGIHPDGVRTGEVSTERFRVGGRYRRGDQAEQWNVRRLQPPGR